MRSIVIIGNGMVSYKFCERFIAQAPKDAYRITVIGEEYHPAYDRVHLSEFFSGKSAEDLHLASNSWYKKNGIYLQTGELVTEIDRSSKTVTTNKNLVYTYDVLVLATGSVPFVPPIAGIEKKGVFVYRTIEDLEQIEAYGKKLGQTGSKRPAAVLGGGLLGLEAANAIKELGLETHVVEFAPRLMPRQLDNNGSLMLQKTIEEMGLYIHLNKSTKAILGEDAITGLQFADDHILETDMLIISAGIRPRDELARHADLEVGARGGVVVDATMMTSDPSIYAMGEVASYNEMCYGLVAPGYDMASVVVSSILEEEKLMPAIIDMSTKLKLIGTDVASFGDAMIEGDDFTTIAISDENKKVYKRINISKDGQKLLGGILVGDASSYNMLLQITQNAMALPPNPEDLILEGRGGDGGSIGSVMDFPDSAVICSCENVLKGDITDTVTSGVCCTLKDLAKHTKATSGCGGCKPMVVDLLNSTLESMGQTVKPVICEHFDYSRQELFDIVKVKQILSYDEALDQLGKGDGCEVCKPALASIFAGIYNEIATVQETIQDTNDRYLANIQRNGSYSVVPRVAGGEITPDKLIVIGQVAKKYDLYTKITGGQRIDLFGARLDQLPLIWGELIAAGFESGHAYGKSLRTVKSCVGSTWCRYGMDESVSFAIEMEDRYKGIRSPHKLKGGVSGCIRECAEARGKDFGVIAVEGGWNLYVCGNGGANPKHAQLLASEIDNETCIKYVDRFLMYYIKTAPPLTRTAAWLEKLEGGMDYLKSIIVDDTLGIAEDLEKEMETLVHTYKCEWTEVINNPELRARFKHFVNTEDTDENMEFVPLRDQKMPKTWK